MRRSSHCTQARSLDCCMVVLFVERWPRWRGVRPAAAARPSSATGCGLQSPSRQWSAEACSICSNLTTAARWTMGIVSTEIRILHKIYYWNYLTTLEGPSLCLHGWHTIELDIFVHQRMQWSLSNIKHVFSSPPPTLYLHCRYVDIYKLSRQHLKSVRSYCKYKTKWRHTTNNNFSSISC